MSDPQTAPFLDLPFLRRDIELRERSDGALLMRSRVPLGAVAPHVPHLLSARAHERPSAIWLAQRTEDGQAWRTLSYGDAWSRVQSVAAWLIQSSLPGRSVVVLSGNSLEHAVVELAAMVARMPYVPITPAYSLLSRDYRKLQAMVEAVQPAVVFVQDGAAFEPALRALPLEGARVLVGTGSPTQLSVPVEHWDAVVTTPVGTEVQDSLQAVRPQTVAKVLFTSGSTGVPKAVPITQAMLCATTAMHAVTVQRDVHTPPSVLLEWLPWSHVAGGTAIFNSVLEDGGTLYLDDGRPIPGEFDKTLRNLLEISPTRFSSVPAGYAMLADALERDEALGLSFFRCLKRLTSSGAKLPESVYRRIQAQAVRHTGHRIPFVAGYGSTETCAATTVVHWPAERSGLVGLPQPGVELKLVPLDDTRYEVRVKGPSVMAGYLRQPQATADAFDAEGYYAMGDAVTFVDRSQPQAGLAFAGRVAEEFKLQSGIFVRVGSLRVEAVSALAPWVSDVVVTGADRPYVGLLAWLQLPACRRRFGDLTAESLVALPELQELLLDALRQYNAQHTGSSMRVQRLRLLTRPPSMDAGEITDKGYVNQRAVLALREADVEALYATVPDASVLLFETRRP